MYGGMHLGWGVFNDQIYMQYWFVEEENLAFELFIVSWFIGVILGCLYNCFVSMESKKEQTYVRMKDFLYKGFKKKSISSSSSP